MGWIAMGAIKEQAGQMKTIEKSRYYKWHMAVSRFRNGLFLFSLRNFIMRFGVDIDPYYLEREGLDQSNVPAIRGDATEYRIESIRAEEIGILENIMGMDVKKLKADIEAGQLCIGLKRGAEIAALMFAETRNFEYKYRTFHLGKNEAYLLNMYTFEAYRGKNLAPYLRYHSYKLLEDQGIDKLYSISAYFNKSSLKFKQKLNAQHLQLLLYVGLFKRFHWNYTLKTY